MKQPPYALGSVRRGIVLEALLETARFRGWFVEAAHVRSDHAHILVSGNDLPQRMVKSLKAYASRRVREGGFDGKDRRRWTRGYSCRGLYRGESVIAAARSVIGQNGEPMSVFDGATVWPTR